MHIIAVDGRSGSGKTRYAEALVAAAQSPAAVLHMDDLYAGWHGLLSSPGDLTRLVLAPLAAGERATYRRFDWQSGRFAEAHQVAPVGLLVVEGVGSSAAPATRFYDERIWLTASELVRRTRALARDGETFAPHWDSWRTQEDRLFPADPPAWVDRVIRTDPDPALVSALSARLLAADPMGISHGLNTDEYDPEAVILADRLPGVDPEAAAVVVRECFRQMFAPVDLPAGAALTALTADLSSIVAAQTS